MARLVEGAVAADDASTVMFVDDARAARLVAALVAEGLVVRDGDSLRLP
jgi:hypothetical protein